MIERLDTSVGSSIHEQLIQTVLQLPQQLAGSLKKPERIVLEVNGVRSTIVLEASTTARKMNVPRVKLPHNTTWSNLTVRFVDDSTAQIIAGDYIIEKTYEELGLIDRRTHEPNYAWGVLMVFARNHGTFSWGDAAASERARAHVKLLRQHLRQLFGIDEDPFHPYRRRVGWRTKFYVSFVAE